MPVLKAVPVEVAIHRVILYLHHEYDPAVGLLRKSPITSQALSCVGDSTLAAQLRAPMTPYGSFRHGLIEALVGAAITWPPQTPAQVELKPGIWLERRDQQPMTD